MSQRHDPAYRLACRVRRSLEDLAAQAPDPLGRFADSLGATSRGVDYAL